ncbi:hypothetical protein QBC34DRAFT_374138 [Podospora aff. communis PSN243]|uniref:Uncharacterized protein n=1 Tax=Podospora aff. communis PSN243 TaxID=3040156 RepID=A0AAV9H897_9PEZI|nr:hypothetical protein QBC34DRAFT_374138 [Podospora aff. communis PSN243]
MKLTTLAWLSATLLPTTFADQMRIESLNRASFATWTFNSGAKETVIPLHDGCRKNPGPRGMTDLCLYSDRGGWGYFFFEGERDWRCLRLTSNSVNLSGLGVEIWSEVSCESWE